MSALLFCGVPRFGRFVAHATTILLFWASVWPAQAQHKDTLRSSVKRVNALLSRELWGVQVSGSLGGCVAGWLSDPVSISVYRETPMKNRKDKAWAVRPELGLSSLLEGRDNVFLASLLASVELRNYYNLKKRLGASKDIGGNAGNFIAARIYLRSPGIPLSPEPTPQPDTFGHGGATTSGQWYVSPKRVGMLGVIPTWGIRRNIGRHINYEFGLGVGGRSSLFHRYLYPIQRLRCTFMWGTGLLIRVVHSLAL